MILPGAPSLVRRLKETLQRVSRTRNRPPIEVALAKGIAPNFAVIDVETTGLDPTANRIIEVAIVEVDCFGSVLDEFSTLLDVPGDDELGAGFIHGISRPMLRGAPTFPMLMGELGKRLAGRIVVGHVISFDLDHLQAEFVRAGQTLPELQRAVLCTRDLARAFFPPGPRTLLGCCDQAQITIENAHTALGDARATAELLIFLLNQRSSGTNLSELQRNASSIEWPSDLATPFARPPKVRSSWIGAGYA